MRAIERKESMIYVSSKGASGISDTYDGLGKRADLEFAEFWSQNVMKSAKKNEVDSYLKENLLSPMSDIEFNIFLVVKNRCNTLSYFLKTGPRYFGNPGVYCFIRVSFQYRGRVVDQYHNRLSPHTIDVFVGT